MPWITTVTGTARSILTTVVRTPREPDRKYRVEHRENARNDGGNGSRVIHAPENENGKGLTKEN